MIVRWPSCSPWSDDSFLRRIQERQQAGFDFGAHVYISIIETDSRRLAVHYPPAQGLNVLGDPLPTGREWPFRDSKRLFYRTSPNDRITRLLTAVPLFDGEFTLMVGTAEADYLAPWRAERSETIAAALLLALR